MSEAEGPLITFVFLGIIFYIGMIVHFTDSTTKNHNNNKERLRMRLKYIVALWVLNVICFATVLWVGAYYIDHLGETWAKGPYHGTLISLTMSKIILSALLLRATFTKNKGE